MTKFILSKRWHFDTKEPQTSKCHQKNALDVLLHILCDF